jgi:hypothetical protein
MDDNRCAIDEAIEPAKSRLGRCNCGGDRGRVCEVEADRERVRAAHRSDSCLERIRTNVGERDPGALSRQKMSGRSAYAASRARDKDPFALVRLESDAVAD